MIALIFATCANELSLTVSPAGFAPGTQTTLQLLQTPSFLPKILDETPVPCLLSLLAPGFGKFEGMLRSWAVGIS